MKVTQRRIETDEKPKTRNDVKVVKNDNEEPKQYANKKGNTDGKRIVKKTMSK